MQRRISSRQLSRRGNWRIIENVWGGSNWVSPYFYCDFSLNMKKIRKIHIFLKNLLQLSWICDIICVYSFEIQCGQCVASCIAYIYMYTSRVSILYYLRLLCSSACASEHPPIHSPSGAPPPRRWVFFCFNAKMRRLNFALKQRIFYWNYFSKGHSVTYLIAISSQTAL